MIYCRKCSRLLEEEVSICPYCGNLDENATLTPKRFENSENSENVEIEKNTVLDSAPSEQEVAEHISTEQKNMEHMSMGQASTESVINIPETIGFIDYNNKNKQSDEPVKMEFSEEKTVYKGVVIDEQDALSSLMKFILTLGTIFLPIIGIVAGIILMTGNKKNMGFGIALLSLAIIVSTLWVVLCCAIVMAIE